MTANNNVASWCQLHSLKNKLIVWHSFMLYLTSLNNIV